VGVKIFDLVQAKEIDISGLKGKAIAIDSSLFLYQFLTSIRQPDGALLTDSKGRVTSHLVGLFNRTTKLMQLGIKPIFVFDGKPSDLKFGEIGRRSEAKEVAAKLYEKAAEQEEKELMAKYASRTTRLTKEMIDDAKRLVSCLGLPVVQAPSEGEAQASHLTKKGDAWAVASNDADCLVFGATRLIKNLAISGRKKPSGLGFVRPELIELKQVLDELGIKKEQMIALAMLVGTDFDPGGIKGIGPKKAIQLVKEYGTKFPKLFEEVKWNDFFNYDWKLVFDIFAKPDVTDDYEIKFKPANRQELLKFLVDEREFGRERVEKALDLLKSSKHGQKGLGDFA